MIVDIGVSGAKIFRVEQASPGLGGWFAARERAGASKAAGGVGASAGVRA
jgi:hypothetical protein